MRPISSVALGALTMALPIVAQLYGQQVMGGDNLNLTYIHEKLVDAEIIPTVMDDFKPLLSLDASWKSHAAALGNTLHPTDLQSSPSVRLKEADTESPQAHHHMTYVVTLTDPDAPSRDDPKWAEVCHWIAAGIRPPPGTSTSHLDDVIEYKPPGPPPKTGKHRYVFLVFVPANGTTDKLNLEKPADRKHWGSDQKGYGVRQWAEKHGLIPVAANFIYAQNKKQ